jgi:hypothetical protein
MENILKYAILLLSFLYIGCGTVDSNSPSEVNGEWQGLAFENDNFTGYLRLHIEDGSVLGSYRVGSAVDAFSPVRGTLLGNADSFTMQVQVGAEWTAQWTYFGYIQDEKLCLVRDLLPSPVRCLSPVSTVNE